MPGGAKFADWGVRIPRREGGLSSEKGREAGEIARRLLTLFHARQMNDDHGFGQDEFEDELLVLLNTRDPELICAVIVALAGSGDRALAYICQKVVLEDC